MNQELWLIIASIAASVQALVVLVAVVFAIIQLRESTRARSLDAFLAISQDLKNESDARKFIYSNSIQKEYLSDSQIKMVDSILLTFDRLGVLVEHGLIPNDVAFSLYYDVILRIWHKTESYIIKNRFDRKSDTWMIYFEYLKNKCWEYWSKEIKKYRGEWKYLKKPEDIYKFFKDVRSNNLFCPKCGGKFFINDSDEKVDNNPKACKVCGYIHYENSAPCVGALIIKNDEVLLIKRAIDPFKDYWDIPGGFLELGENPINGIIREVKEETNLAIEPVKILDIFIDVYGSEKKSTLNICYICKLIEGKPIVGSDAKEIEWFSINALPDKIAFEWSKKAFDLLKENYNSLRKIVN